MFSQQRATLVAACFGWRKLSRQTLVTTDSPFAAFQMLQTKGLLSAEGIESATKRTFNSMQGHG
jgi:hypothetical protein